MQTLLTEFCVLCFFTITPSRFKAFPSGVPRYLCIAPGFIACVSASEVLRFSWHPPLPIGGRRLCSRVSDSAWMTVPCADVFLVQFVFLKPPQAKWIARNTQVLLQGARLVDEGTLFLPRVIWGLWMTRNYFFKSSGATKGWGGNYSCVSSHAATKSDLVIFTYLGFRFPSWPFNPLSGSRYRS